MLCGEHGGAPYDLLAAALDVAPVRLRGITARWRRAGYAATGQLGPGPAWCWLTAAGMADTGLGYRPGPPSLGPGAARPRAAGRPAGAAGRPGLAAAPAVVAIGTAHPPQRPVRRAGTCPTPKSGGRPWTAAHAGLVWAIETELTAKTAARTAVIMAGLAAAGYDRILYFTAPAARPAVTRAAATLPAAPDHHPRPSPGRLHPRPDGHEQRRAKCPGKHAGKA